MIMLPRETYLSFETRSTRRVDGGITCILGAKKADRTRKARKAARNQRKAWQSGKTEVNSLIKFYTSLFEHAFLCKILC